MPGLIQLPLLFQEDSEVAHGGERVRVLRTKRHFAHSKTSAVKGLRLPSQDGAGTWGSPGLLACGDEKQKQHSY